MKNTLPMNAGPLITSSLSFPCSHSSAPRPLPAPRRFSAMLFTVLSDAWAGGFQKKPPSADIGNAESQVVGCLSALTTRKATRHVGQLASLRAWSAAGDVSETIPPRPCPKMNKSSALT